MRFHFKQKRKSGPSLTTALFVKRGQKRAILSTGVSFPGSLSMLQSSKYGDNWIDLRGSYFIIVFPPHDVSKFKPLRDFVGMLLEVVGVVAVETEKIV